MKQRVAEGQLILPMLEVMAERGGKVTTAELYDPVAARVGVTAEERQEVIEGGYRQFDRKVRWAQQMAKEAQLIDRIDRGVWSILQAGEKMLLKAKPGVVLDVYETPQGRALWSCALAAMGYMESGSVNAIVTSPPYPLNAPKEYGNVALDEYLGWFLPFTREMQRVLRHDGSLFLNVGNTWVQGSPVQSLFPQRLLLKLCDEQLWIPAQHLIWHNPSAMPGPAAWVTVRRWRLKQSYEYVFWLSKTPHPKADNRKALVPYSDSMKQLLARGGQKAGARPSGYAMKDGAFRKDNGGAIRPDTLIIPNTASNDAYHKACKRLGLPPHPARFPKELAEILLRVTTDPGDLVYDPFGGSGTVAAVAEELGRRWVTSELDLPYVVGSALRFPKEAVRWSEQVA